MLLGPLRAPPDRHFTVYSSGVRGQEKVKCSAVNGGEEGPEVLQVIGAEALLWDLNRAQTGRWYCNQPPGGDGDHWRTRASSCVPHILPALHFL